MRSQKLALEFIWLILACVLVARTAGAQTGLTVSADVVTPGNTITATVTGPPGQFFAIIGSSVGSGMSYGGVALGVGADLAILAQGALDGTGQAAVTLTPPFRGSVLDRYYLQAATSSSPAFIPLSVSAGRVIRNGDLVAGLNGPQGPAGPIGPTGPQGPAGIPTGGGGAFDFTNANGFIANGTFGSGSAIATSGAGTRVMWNPRKAAFRAGYVNGAQWNDANVGNYSVALGANNSASGAISTAMGQQTTASGLYATSTGYLTVASGEASTAMGFMTVASDQSSTALGQQTKATAPFATAMGDLTTASGVASTAMGAQTTASGTVSTAIGSQTSAGADYSTAIGRQATANHNGSFVYGDASGTPVVSTAPNQFVVKASGGTIFYSNSLKTTGVSLAAGGGAWANLSDARMKTNFRDLDGDDVLAKLARIPIREWNYISQDAGVRHVGPTAQDFHDAFGLGEDERHISTLDPDGISLKAIQALDARSHATIDDVARLGAENAALRSEVAVLREALAELRRAVEAAARPK